MTHKFSVIFFCFYFQMIYAAVLLWSDQEIRVAPLQQFTLKDLTKLTENLERPDVHIFQSPSQLSSVFKEILSGYYSAYTPNGQIESENITCKCLLSLFKNNQSWNIWHYLKNKKWFLDPAFFFEKII